MAHWLTLLQTPAYSSGTFVCNLCGEKGCGPVYHCSDCDFDIHITCAANVKQQTHFSHPQHPLHLCQCISNHTCDGCGESIQKWAFRCQACDYDMHSLCVRAPRFILHFSHPHPLALTKASEHQEVPCNACYRVTRKLFYRCHDCDYNLHQFCTTLARKLTHFRHPQHTLRLQYQSPNGEAKFTCAECGKHGKAWHFACTNCQYYIHPRCTKISHEIPYPDLGACLQEEGQSNAAISATSSPILQNVSCIPTLSSEDLEIAEKVLRFAKEMVKASVSTATVCNSAEGSSDEQDVCPTCFEGFEPANPKRSTSCGHHFHLPCILNWMERCTQCPICRKNVTIRM